MGAEVALNRWDVEGQPVFGAPDIVEVEYADPEIRQVQRDSVVRGDDGGPLDDGRVGNARAALVHGRDRYGLRGVTGGAAQLAMRKYRSCSAHKTKQDDERQPDAER